MAGTLRRLCCCALAALGVAAAVTPASADTRTLYARAAPDVYGWDYPSQSRGAPSCSSSDQGCRYSTCSAQARSGFPNAWLVATEFDDWSIPAGYTISVSRVAVSVYGSWASSVEGTFQVEVRGLPSTPRQSFTRSGFCRWLIDWDITAQQPDGWTKEEVDALQVAIRRSSSSTPTQQFWLDSFRIHLTYTLVPLTGACCFSAPCTSTCDIRTQQDCAAAGGAFLGFASTCTPGACLAQPCLGACCFQAPGTSQCVVETAAQCAGRGQGWTYRGDNVACNSQSCPTPPPITGGCCAPGQPCIVATLDNCLSVPGRQYLGDHTPCPPPPCPTMQGACCLPTSVCRVIDAAQCDQLGGTFRGAGSSCPTSGAPDACPVLGACCQSILGNCFIATPDLCDTVEGVFVGPGSVCPVGQCDPVGPCCIGYACVLLSVSACFDQDGEYHGPGEACPPDLCDPTVACCLGCAGGGCLVLRASECDTRGGFPVDPDPCNPQTCTAPPSNDTCSGALNLNRSLGVFSFDATNDCDGAAGTADEENEACDVYPEVDVWYRWSPPSNGTVAISTVGLTAAETDTTITLREAQCSAEPLLCREDSGSTLQTTLTRSVRSNRSYYIQIGVYDDGAPLSGQFSIVFAAAAVFCPADFNGDASTNVQDVYDFLSAWSAGQPSTDFDGSGDVTVQDLYDFLSAWLATCE